jgi:hypothetical protein
MRSKPADEDSGVREGASEDEHPSREFAAARMKPDRRLARSGVRGNPPFGRARTGRCTRSLGVAPSQRNGRGQPIVQGSDGSVSADIDATVSSFS